MDAKKKEEKRRKKIEDAKNEKIFKKNIGEYIKNRIRKSVTEKKIFVPENKYAAIFKKNNMKKNRKMKRISSSGNIKTETTKKFKRLNAYNDVSKIITFIDNSNINSQSKICRNHYDNIKITKNMDKAKEKLLIKNEIFSEN